MTAEATERTRKSLVRSNKDPERERERIEGRAPWEKTKPQKKNRIG